MVVTLDEWTAVVGLADNTGLALTEDGDVKVAISVSMKPRFDVMLILRYLPHASVETFTTTGLLPSSLTIENIVLSVLLERRSEVWTERLRVGTVA